MLLPSNVRPPREDRPQSPQLTLRVAVLGGVAVLLFTVLFFRLWVLQVLSTDTYAKAADQNQLRPVIVRAPRGVILDRNNQPLVMNRPSDAVTLDPAQMPNVARACAAAAAPPAVVKVPKRPDLLRATSPRRRRINARRLTRWRRARAAALRRHANAVSAARVSWTACLDPCREGATAATVPSGRRGLEACRREAAVLRRLLRDAKGDPRTASTAADFGYAIRTATQRSPFEPVVLIDDAPRELVVFLKEHGTAFPGIRISTRTVRDYRTGPAGAQLYGLLGEASERDLADKARFVGLLPGDVVGLSGVERAYDRYLRGTDGRLRLKVDAANRPEGAAAMAPAPVPGRDLRLTLDRTLQWAARRALIRSFALAKAGFSSTNRGAIVVMDANTGEIRAMVSMPDYNPNSLLGKDGNEHLEDLYAEGDDVAPLSNRATSGQYPPGSTFKPVTAIAAGQGGQLGVGDQIPCTGSVKIYDHTYHNFDPSRSTSMDLRQALAESCDTWFYELGRRLYENTTTERREPQAQWGRRLGFGRPTGFELGEEPGRMPSIAWKREFANTYFKDHKSRDYLLNNRWTPGDAVNTSIGQGDTLVTPLQLASLYAMIANGGTLVTPHIGLSVQAPDGSLIKRFAPRARTKVAVNPYLLQEIRRGLLGATHDRFGTARAAFAGFPVAVAGKTGTAQKGNQKDYAWFAGYAPANDPQLVVVAVVEQGGFGGEIAAPAVRDVFKAAFAVPDDPTGSEAPAPRDLRGRPIPFDPVQMANGKEDGNGITPADVTANVIARERRSAAAETTAAGDATGDVARTTP